jgi:small GTP-binding protein
MTYARQDVHLALALTEWFQSQGLSVWFDQDIRAGERYNDQIAEELDKARCVIALWSTASINSKWVHAEADHALRKSAVIPVYLEPVEAPVPYRAFHGVDLVGWTGDVHDPRLRDLSRAVRVLTSGGREFSSTRRTSARDDFLESARAGTQVIREVKLLFVGDGGAGKTSLMKQILYASEKKSWFQRLGNRDPFNNSEPQTPGIAIAKFSCPHRKGTIQVNCWDFGGQEIMHSTHQFFLSQRSIYILVVDGRKQEDIEYWFQMIRTYGGSSPVLVALNKIDENPAFDVNRKFLTDKYPAIRSFHRLSCKTAVGIQEFMASLFETIATAEHMESEWPSSWYAIKQRLEQLNTDFISYDQYEGICRQAGLRDEESMESLAGLLNDLGTIVHFDAPVLRETNVVKPGWLTTAVYKILTSQELAAGSGKLKRQQLSGILDNRLYPKARHDYIIEIMKRFELCFSVDQDEILVPDLLNVEAPDDAFERSNALRYQISYDFFPTSILPRLMVNLGRDIVQDKAWRTGCILSDTTLGVSALIEADRADKSIEVFVSGAERREYFTIVRRSLLDISLKPAGLTFKERIPCICVDCRTRKAPYFFDYSYLIQRKMKGRATVDCERSIEAVSIDALLSGVESPVLPSEGWDVFVSYSSRDLETVQRVVDDMKSRRLKVWWDQTEIKLGDPISKQIELGLRTSRFIVPCISRNQLQSGWCRVEYAGAIHKVISGHTSQKVTPLIIDDLDIAEMPYILCDFRSERLADRRGYQHLLTYIAGH